jgi:uncharacterized protein
MGTVARLRTSTTGEDVAEGLSRHLTAEGLVPERIDTHLSTVLLAGDRAYKVKKPVRLAFVDFGTADARRRYCLEELRLNQRLAPDLYLAVVDLHRQGDRVVPRGPGPVVDTAVLMRRLPPHALASERLARGALQANDLAAFAARLAGFHGEAPVTAAGSAHGTAGCVQSQMRSTLDALAERLGPAALADLETWTRSQADHLSPWFARRRRDGFVREGHGDLHLDNIVVLGPGEVTAFDALEFDPALRWIDTAADAGFLLMDLLAHGRRDLAYGFLNDYLEHSGDYDSVTGLRWYVIWRALVRALVALLRESGGHPIDSGGLRADDYLALARRVSTASGARLLITHGLPGSGKSHVSRQLLERAGAVRVRSDVERRRLWPDRSARYTPEATAATYRRLGDVAGTVLAAGCPVIVDAACTRRTQRDGLCTVARAANAPFTFLECTAPAGVLEQRVAERLREGGDASEADLGTLRALSAADEPLDDDEALHAIRLDTSQPVSVADVVRAWQRDTAAAAPMATAQG